jgi:hypothetical protein
MPRAATNRSKAMLLFSCSMVCWVACATLELWLMAVRLKMIGESGHEVGTILMSV